MRQDISPDMVVQALLRDGVLGFRDKGAFLREGVCPNCQKKSLFVRKAEPWQVMCSREVNCGYTESTRNLLPDLFSEFAKKYPPTEENPRATADAYLGLDRGFDLGRIRGWYEQASHQIPNTTKMFPTVRFYLDPAHSRYWERLIGASKADKQKAHLGGRRKEDGTLYAGDAWTPPGQTLEKGDRVYIVEGIFHAIALFLKGYKAIASLSSSNIPVHAFEEHKGKGIVWTVALDRDTLKKDKPRRFVEKLRELEEKAEVCIPPDARDWDDLYRADCLSKEFMDAGLYRGTLYLCETADEKAYHIYVHAYRKNRLAKFTLDFRNRLYSAEVKEDLQKTLEKEAQDDPEMKLEILRTEHGRDIFRLCCDLKEISNILPTFLYIENNEISGEKFYVFEIAYASGMPKEIVKLDGQALIDPKSFFKAIISKTCGGTFTGSAGNLKYLVDRWLGTRIPTIASVPYIGYVPSLGAYVFNEHAYSVGKEIKLNEYEYFEIGKAGIKTTLSNFKIDTTGEFNPGWLHDFFRAFHWQGMTVLAFFLGSLFVQQIRHEQKSFPFLELTGEPGAGKSTLLEFCWRLLGRDEYEGFDLLKATQAGRRRAFSQVSNLPVVLIESDRDNGEKDAKQRQFSFDEMKPFFNGRGTGTLGVAMRGTGTEEHLFQGTLIISQNAGVDGSEALLQRIVHCHADKKHHVPGTREIARWFEQQKTATVAGFLRVALKNERMLLDTYRAAFAELEARFSRSGLQNERIIKNHAQVAACGHALATLFPERDRTFVEGLDAYILSRAVERESRLRADHPILEQFWDQFDYLNGISKEKGAPDRLNHSADDALIAVNLNHFLEVSRSAGQQIFDLNTLKKLFPNSKRHKFLEYKVVWSKHESRSYKCWIFKKSKQGERA